MWGCFENPFVNDTSLDPRPLPSLHMRRRYSALSLILELNLIWNLLLLIMLILRFHIGINLILLYCILNFIISALVFQTCICSCCCCTFIKVWRYCGLFSALLLLLNTLRGLKKEFKFWFKFVVSSRRIRLQKLDNTETNHPRNAFNGWLRHPLLKTMKKVSAQVFLKWLVYSASTSFHLI